MAKAVGVNGKRAAVIDLRSTDPEGWANDVRPLLKDYADIIVYEMHHRDFSLDSVSGIRNKGKFLALTELGTTTSQGEKNRHRPPERTGCHARAYSSFIRLCICGRK